MRAREKVREREPDRHTHHVADVTSVPATTTPARRVGLHAIRSGVITRFTHASESRRSTRPQHAVMPPAFTVHVRPARYIHEQVI